MVGGSSPRSQSKDQTGHGRVHHVLRQHLSEDAGGDGDDAGDRVQAGSGVLLEGMTD